MTRCATLVCLAARTSLAAGDPKPESARSRSALHSLPVSLADLPSGTRDAVSRVMKDPTVTAVCPAEEFVAHSDVYQWLLDNPDRTAAAWRKLGVEAVEIKALKNG